MEIRTKFNAGDEIFTVKNLGDWIVYPCVIIQVKIKIDRHLNYGDEDKLVKIFYVCLSGDYLLEIPEEKCFTYTEAKEECDRRNKGE